MTFVISKRQLVMSGKKLCETKENNENISVEKILIRKYFSWKNGKKKWSKQDFDWIKIGFFISILISFFISIPVDCFIS